MAARLPLTGCHRTPFSLDTWQRDTWGSRCQQVLEPYPAGSPHSTSDLPGVWASGIGFALHLPRPAL